MHKPIFAFLIGFFCLSASGQSLNKLIQQATELHDQRKQNIFSDQKESLDQRFDSCMQALLRHPDFCGIDSVEIARLVRATAAEPRESGQYFAYHLINFVAIASAENLMVFSWDDLGGGTYHTYTNYVQYQLTDGSCVVQPLDTAEHDWDAGYYQTEKLELAGRNIYVLLGYGTFGGGKQHRKVKFLERIDDALVERMDFYPDGKQLTISSNRGQDPALT
ncbi:MAG: hypothetical protein AAF206_05075, partial [Bacteroidota bacterium]